MFDFGGWEFAVIGVIALLVIGPKDLPRVLHAVGKWVGKARRLASDFQSQLDDAVKQSELNEVKKSVQDAGRDASRAAADLDKEVKAAGEETKSAAEAPETPLNDGLDPQGATRKGLVLPEDEDPFAEDDVDPTGGAAADAAPERPTEAEAPPDADDAAPPKPRES